MIKVLNLRSSFDFGGTETLLLNLYNYPQKQIKFYYAFLKDGSLIPNLHSDTNKYYKTFRKSKLDLGILFQLSKIIRTENISIIHTHQMFELVYAIILKLIHPRIKLFHTIHGYFEENEKWSELERFLIRFTKQTFTVSKAAKNILINKGYPKQKIEVLYNAVNTPTPVSKIELNNFKEKIKYHPNDFIAGMIGSFVWQKDQLTIVKAFNLLKNELPNLKIVLIGKESELSEKCKAILEKKDLNERVFFLGSLENASKYLTLFNVFIMSTLMDTFGIVVIEALLQKIPVVASDIEVMKELSNEGEYFNLFEQQNPIQLAKSLKKIYAQHSNVKIESACVYAKTNYSFEAYMNNLVEKYSL